jgi:KipI family sensor histidine kinase inhibitor
MGLDFKRLALKNKSWRVPVCFAVPYCEDLQDAAEQLQMEQQKLVEFLLASKFKVYMYGFVPGFTYLGGLNPNLDIPRRQTPRLPVPPGSLIIAGGLAGLMPISMPTGWYVVGQTPISLFWDKRSPMVPFAVGDQLKLYAVDMQEYQRLSAENQQDQHLIAGLEQDE